MEPVIQIFGALLLAAMIFLIYRGFRGPTVMDRIVAANTVGTKTTVILLFIGMIFGRLEMFVDFALTYALLNFIGSLSLAWFYQRTQATSIKESESPETQES
jgi:multicomponent Na+:H+ antiporter subunit F